MTDILLDTHIFEWFINGGKRLKKKNRKIIESCRKENDRICLSAITLLEISMLVNHKDPKRRLELSCPVEEWVNKWLDILSIEIIDLSVKICVYACNSLGNFANNKDPHDKIIVATSKVKEISLITQDKKILKYLEEEFCPTV